MDRAYLLMEKLEMKPERLKKTSEISEDVNEEIMLQVAGKNTYVLDELELELFVNVVENEKIKELEAAMFYRKAEGKHFLKLPMNKIKDSIFCILIPASGSNQLVEYYLEVSKGDKVLGKWPTGAPDRLETIRYLKTERKVKYEVTDNATIKINWDLLKDKDVLKFNVYRKEENKNEKYLNVAVCIGCSFEDLDIKENTGYNYKIIPVGLNNLEYNEGILTTQIKPFRFSELKVPTLSIASEGKNYILSFGCWRT